MSDVGRVQTDSSNQSQIESNNMLVVSGLSVTSQNKRVLEDISFKVKKGTSLAIVGPNGGGKTTLFRALLNLIPYTGLSRYSLISAIFGLVSATSGVILSSYVNLPAGPLVVIVGAAIFAGGVVVSSLS